MTIRVIMLGPGEEIVGGISSLVKTLITVLNQKVNLLYFPTVTRRPLKESGKISLLNIALAFSQYIRFLPVIFGFRPHIIHIQTSQGIAWFKDTFFLLAGKLFKCKVILHMHGGNFVVTYDRNNSLLKYYTRKALCLADAVIEVSANRRKSLAQIIPIDRIISLRNCIDVDVFAPCFSSRSANRTQALFLGVVGPSKGTFDLLDAFVRLKSIDCSLKISIAGREERVGDFAKIRSRLQELALEDKFHLLGVVRGKSKIELMEKSSLLVLPSYQEALPMAILEAMAAGLPVVATAIGGIPEVVKDGYNGFLITPGDIETLAEKLYILSSNPHLCEIMGQRSRMIAEKELDVKPYVEKLVALYESLDHCCLK